MEAGSAAAWGGEDRPKLNDSVQKLRTMGRTTDRWICVAKKKPLNIVVRRGALRRFDSLARKTADLPVEVTWDRRLEQRRASDASPGVERRANDRRREPPYTWQVADFVVTDSEE